MKIHLEFDDDEQAEAKQAMHGDVAWACLYDTVYHKINRQHLGMGQPLTAVDIRDYILDYMAEHGVALEGMVE